MAPASADSLAAAIERERPTLRHDSATVLSLSTEGATIEADYAGTALRRLHADFLGETGRASETYYFADRLMLVIRRDYRYDAPLSGRVIDSTIRRFDLRDSAAAPAQAESLRAGARALLAALARRE